MKNWHWKLSPIDCKMQNIHPIFLNFARSWRTSVSTSFESPQLQYRQGNLHCIRECLFTLVLNSVTVNSEKLKQGRIKTVFHSWVYIHQLTPSNKQKVFQSHPICNQYHNVYLLFHIQQTVAVNEMRIDTQHQ